MIYKIHYGLWYGALVGIIPFMFNYAQYYSNATGAQHGYLYTVIPFAALLAKPLVCSIADKYAAHKLCLITFIILTAIAYGALGIYPFFTDLVTNRKDIVWLLYCVSAFVGNTSMCVVNSIGDSLAVQSCQRKEKTYGEYRLWGPVGFGIFGAIWGFANEIPFMPKFTPGIITMVAILLTNSIIIAFWHDKEEFKIVKFDDPDEEDSDSSNNPNYGSTQEEVPRQQADPKQEEQTAEQQVQLVPSRQHGDDLVIEDSTRSHTKINRFSLLWSLSLKHKSIYFYLFLFTFCGIQTGILWQFFFRFLEQISMQRNQNFSLIATLTLPIQSLGGELVFFMLSGSILKKLGAPLTLVLCLLSFSARYLLYAYFIPSVDLHWILLVELLQGPAFGLMYSVLTHQANHYSTKIAEIIPQDTSPEDVKLRSSLHATLQGIFGASFEGLGLGLGALIGGLSYDVSPILMWKLAGYSSLAVSIACNFLYLLEAR